jgi:threonine dehydrogenase-like Zn-dependent dehydrogenase
MSSTPTTRNFLVHESPEQLLTLKSEPVQTPTPHGSALVRILSTTTRPHNKASFAGHSPLPVTAPYIPGHSAIARIIEVGPDAVSLEKDQLVWIDGFLKARDDHINTQILLGFTHLGADKPKKLFDAWSGVWASVATVPQENCVPLNESVLCGKMGYTFDDLEYVGRLAVANGGVSVAALRAGETVIVCPATGHFSGAVAEFAAQIGCNVIALTRSAAKLEPLTSRHANITPVELTGDVEADAASIRAVCPQGMADAMIDVSPPEATANPSHLYSGLQVLRCHSRVVFLGALGNVNIPYGTILLRNITIKGQWMYTREMTASLVKMIESGVVKLGKEAGHNVRAYKMEDWRRAIEESETATNWGEQITLNP